MRMRPDGSQKERLIPYLGHYDAPYWSPDGEWLYFRADNGRGWAIYRLNIESEDTEPITDSEGNPRQMAFSPDGDLIVFMAGNAKFSEIYTMRPDGSDIRRLTNNDTEQHSPVWSPDGQWIAYTTTTMSQRRILNAVSIIRPDGTEECLIAMSGDSPAWLRMPNLRWDRHVFPILGIDLLAAMIVLTWLRGATLPSPCV